jgi:hypothetical protein
MREESSIEVTIPLRRANTASFAFFAVAIVLFGGMFAWRFGWYAFLLSWQNFLTDYLILIGSIFGGMILHELLHAVTWAIFCRLGFRSISFGINWRALAPFVHCGEYLQLRHYTVGVLLPGLALGLFPAILSLITGSGWALCFGIFFTAGAAGDFLAWKELRRFKKTDQVLDHRENIGFVVRRGH